MELKVKMFEPVLEEKSFQSHLYGIESNMGAPYKVGGGGFNRTFMELKENSVTTKVGITQFQSHLYGIERSMVHQS